MELSPEINKNTVEPVGDPEASVRAAHEPPFFTTWTGSVVILALACLVGVLLVRAHDEDVDQPAI